MIYSPNPQDNKYFPFELKSIPVTESLWAFNVADNHLCLNGASLVFTGFVFNFFSLALGNFSSFSLGSFLVSYKTRVYSKL